MHLYYLMHFIEFSGTESFKRRLAAVVDVGVLLSGSMNLSRKAEQDAAFRALGFWRGGPY